MGCGVAEFAGIGGHRLVTIVSCPACGTSVFLHKDGAARCRKCKQEIVVTIKEVTGKNNHERNDTEGDSAVANMPPT